MTPPADDSETPRSPRVRRRIALVLRAGRYVLIFAVVAFAIWYFAGMWEDLAPALQRMEPWWVAASMAVLLTGLALNTVAWVTLLRGLGHMVPFVRSAQIMLVGQLGKYVPGSAWAYLLQMELGRQHGIARARVLIASLYAAGVGVVASLILGALALPSIARQHPQLLWLFLLLPVGLACLHPAVMTVLANVLLKLFRRPPLDHRVRLQTTLGALAWSLGSYLLYGVHLWLLTGGRAPFSDVVLFSAAIGIAFTASLFAFVLPSGVGVREAILIGMMGLTISAVDASAISLASRAMFTAGDLLTAGAAALAAAVMHRRLHSAEVATSEYDDLSASPSRARPPGHRSQIGSQGSPEEKAHPSVPPPSYLVIIPTYNERENIERIVARTLAAAPDSNILIVDDASPDGTGRIAESLKRDDPRIEVLHRTEKNGLGGAYLAGFAFGLQRGYDLLVEMDADGSHPPERLPALISAVADDATGRIGGAIGSRWVEGGSVVDWPRSREIISRGGSWYARSMLGLPVRDVTAGYRVYRAATLASIRLDEVESRGYCFQIDLTRRAYEAGYRLVEVPIEFREREAGQSKMNGRIVWEAVVRVTIWGASRVLPRRRRSISGSTAGPDRS